MFSTIATSRDSTSLKSKTVTGISCNPALCAANHLLSPATISYLPLTDFFGLTAIGWIIPFFFYRISQFFKFSLTKILSRLIGIST